MSILCRSGIFAASVLMAASFALFAQSERGTIAGTVRDSTGAVVPGAAVKVTNTATNLVTNLVSNDSGDYIAASLPAGNYNVSVSKSGFRAVDLKGVTVDAATTVRGDVTLEVGQAMQSIEIQASAASLQTEDAKSSVTISNRLVNDLPLVVGGAVRSPFDLAMMTPEAKNLGGDAGFSLGGGQAASYGATLEGISANTSRALQKSWVSSNAPSVEAMSEFTVDTNGFKAEYGHAGGGVMTFVAKSGTNDLHGSAYEFLRNNDFDANDWFSNRAGKARQIYKQNDFGFTVGGPVWIPKVYNGKDKTFFFFSYEGFRNRNGATNFATSVPTAEMYNGDFSNWVNANNQQIPIFDPTTQTTAADGTVTRNPFPGNKIPTSLFDPQAVQALKTFQASGVLTPNTGARPGTSAYVTNNYLVTNGTQVQPVNKFSIKGDRVFSSKQRISGYYGYDRESIVPGPDGPPTLPGLYSTYNDLQQKSDVFRMSWDWTISPSKLNHFYAGGNNWRQDHKPPQEYIGNWKSKFCMGNVPDCNDNLVVLNFSGLGSWGGQADNGSENTIYGFNDDFTWIRGSHTLKFGGQYQLTHYNGFGRQCISGCVNFSFTETGRPGVTDSLQGGNGFASFLLGYADNGQIDTIRFIGQQFPYFAGFIQDDWRVTRKWVLNIGVRWEASLPPTGLEDRWADFSPTTPNPAAGNRPGAILFAGSGPGRVGTRSLADSYFSAFGPHIGTAYSINDKTVIRASYARAFAELMAVTGSAHTMGFTLTQTFPNLNNGLTPTYLMKNGMPPWVAPPFVNPSVSNGTNVSWWQGSETTRPPETNNINFSIQRQLSRSMLVEGSYNAVIGTHLQTQLLNYNQVNPIYLRAFGSIPQSTTVLNSAIGSAVANAAGVFAPYPGFTGSVRQALRPFPQYQTIQTYEGQGDHSGHSAYHSAIIRFEKRYSSGLTFGASYVFSKLLTDSDSYWGNGVDGGGGGGSLAADHFNRRLEKSIGEFDVTHNFKTGFSYELPFGKHKPYLTSGVGRWLLGDWRTAGAILYLSGQPVRVTTSYSLPLFQGRSAPYVTSYDGWQPNWSGGFDPSRDRFFVPYCADPNASCNGPFPYQGNINDPLQRNIGFGNMTRYNPKVRQFANYTENLSVARSFPIRESVKLEFRAEGFNVFNRHRFGTGGTGLQGNTFGQLTSSGDLLNTPRQLQLALKLYF